MNIEVFICFLYEPYLDMSGVQATDAITGTPLFADRDGYATYLDQENMTIDDIEDIRNDVLEFNSDEAFKNFKKILAIKGEAINPGDSGNRWWWNKTRKEWCTTYAIPTAKVDHIDIHMGQEPKKELTRDEAHEGSLRDLTEYVRNNRFQFEQDMMDRLRGKK